MSRQIIPVVFAVDDHFAPMCSVAIASLIDHADPGKDYAVYVFYDELSEENLRKLEGMSAKSVSIQGIRVSEHVDRKVLYVHDWISIATYYRFFAADILLQHDKILYLDSDIVILRDVAELYETPIGENWLGGVVIFRESETEIESKAGYLESLGMRPETYVNAGVLLMNTRAFREEHVYSLCMEYLKKHRGLKWMDQDVLNAVCLGKIAFLPDIWNLQQLFMDDDVKAGKDVSQTGIVHYTTGDKPGRAAFRLSHLFAYQYALYSPYRSQLTEQYLKVNTGLISSVRRETLEMAGRGEIGPKYFMACLKRWIRGKLRKRWR